MYGHYPDFDKHSLITTRYDPGTGLSAIVAIHNDSRGPAIGGCRMLPYQTVDAAMTDALRLSRGMTYKTAIAGIPYGGGKAVIIGDPHTQKSRELLHAFGAFVQSLDGRYITSFDSGTTLDDVRTIGERTEHASGVLAQAGNASDSTANGVYHCLRKASEHLYGSANMGDVRVAIQGVGNVGARLARLLARDGANLVIADADPDLAASIAAETNAVLAEPKTIMEVDADIFAPCALGAILSASSIPRLKARIVVGGANNQLATAEDDDRLRARGILYCPDYLANAGGIIDLHYQMSRWTQQAVDRHVETLAETFAEIIERSLSENRGTAAVANMIAEDRFRY